MANVLPHSMPGLRATPGADSSANASCCQQMSGTSVMDSRHASCTVHKYRYHEIHLMHARTLHFALQNMELQVVCPTHEDPVACERNVGDRVL